MAVTGPQRSPSTRPTRRLKLVAPVSVFIAEPSAPLCSALRRRIRHIDSFRVVGQALTPQDTVAKVLQLKPQIVLIDCELDGMDDPLAYQALKESLPDSLVIVLLDRPDQDLLMGYMAAGIDGCCLRETSLDILPAALPVIAAGGFWLGPELRADLRWAVATPEIPEQPARESRVAAGTTRRRRFHFQRRQVPAVPAYVWAWLVATSMLGLVLGLYVLDTAFRYEFP